MIAAPLEVSEGWRVRDWQKVEVWEFEVVPLQQTV